MYEITVDGLPVRSIRAARMVLLVNVVDVRTGARRVIGEYGPSLAAIGDRLLAHSGNGTGGPLHLSLYNLGGHRRRRMARTGNVGFSRRTNPPPLPTRPVVATFALD